MIQQSPTERAREVLARHSLLALMNGVAPVVHVDAAIRAMIEFASQAAQPAEADGVERPALPAEAVHAADCDHPRAQIWMCKCPRPVFAATPTAPATDAGEVERCGWCANFPDSERCDCPATPPAPNDDLRAALEPFAREADEWDGVPDHARILYIDTDDEMPRVTVADFRRARAALKENHRG